MIYFNFVLQGRAKTQAASGRFVAAVVEFEPGPFRVKPVVEKDELRRDFLQLFRFFL